MKKIVLVLLAALTLALTIAPVAFAETDCEKQICKIACSFDGVESAKCIVWERTAVVALKTKQFATKSKYEQFVGKLTEQIKSECQVDRVFVTRNPKVMKEIEELAKLGDEQREQAIKELVERLSRFRPIRKIDIPQITIGR